LINKEEKQESFKKNPELKINIYELNEEQLNEFYSHILRSLLDDLQ
jgi:hypothetical protein